MRRDQGPLRIRQIVLAREAAVTDHVGSRDRNEPTSDVFVCHAPPQPSGWGEKSLARFGDAIHRRGGARIDRLDIDL